MEGVEDDLEVVLVEQAERVAPHLGGDDAVGLRVVGLDTEVEGLGVVEQPHHGLLGRRLAFRRLLLDELVDDRGLQPDLLVEAAVDLRPALDAHRRHAVVLARRKDGESAAPAAAPIEDEGRLDRLGLRAGGTIRPVGRGLRGGRVRDGQ